MITKVLKPRQALNKAFLKVKPNRTEIECFKENLIKLLDSTNNTESEEFHKNIVTEFLKKTYYDPNHYINTKGRNDLVIHNGDSSKSTVGVIIEAKKPTNKNEMISTEDINSKAFQELILYYLRERFTNDNVEIRHLVVTNIYEWYIFDAVLFDRVFAQDRSLVRKFIDFENGRLTGTKTEFFYKQIAEPFIESVASEIEFTYFNIQDYQKPLLNNDSKDDNSLIALFKVLSPEHMLKQPFKNDNNSLDKRFYSELLHIIGLTERKEGGKKLIGRNKLSERSSGTILEDTIIQLDSLDKLSRLDKPSQFGTTSEEKLFNVALELCITWINRILFLKLLEAQLISYHKGDGSYSFLNIKSIKSYDDLNSLFFQVLARRHSERNEDVSSVFEKVPYLNSSLFEPTGLEQDTLIISNLKDDKTIPVISSTVLKDQKGRKRAGRLRTLEYLFDFLDAYDFSSEGSEEIQEENKTLINASVLGLIFEKINGYKDGPYFTPGFITMHMCREAIRKTIMQRFNETKGWTCTEFGELYNKIEDPKEANRIVNSIKICDPAVGSGHFLVSALNEIIAVKHDLKILQDRSGKRLKEYKVEVTNDELIVTDDDGELFEYNPKSDESQRVQEAIFHEKQTIIENCLFGVDINSNSVKICRLRLWIELLKNSYYKNATELETLPNIDINIKCGNSLVSRFELRSDLKRALKKSSWTIDGYRNAVDTYRNAKSKEQKKEMERLISDIKTDFRSEISLNDPKVRRLRGLSGELIKLKNQQQLFEMSKIERDNWNKKIKKLTESTKKLEADIAEIQANKIFENAFEWRFEFPEALDDNGDFWGFDMVIGNPPYIKEDTNRDSFNGLRHLECYQGKMDIWYLFGDLGLKLLKPDRYLCYIATNNWVTNAGASKFRNMVVGNSQIVSLVDFGPYMVFENASIQTMIMLFRKTSQIDEYEFDYRRLVSKDSDLSSALNILSYTPTENCVFLAPKIVKESALNETLTFYSDADSVLLEKIGSKRNFTLRGKPDRELDLSAEIGSGIDVLQDFVSKKNVQKLSGKSKVGDGVFVLSKSEIEEKKLSESEKSILKPYYTSEQLQKYYGNSDNKYWIIYTKSDIGKQNPETNVPSINSFPNIKNHLDKYKNIITSANKPYGLHRARDQYLFEGEKIFALRKCASDPRFTYTDFDCFVSRAFLVIKTDRIDLKYLTGLLNSRLIAYWLRKKGKMQGNAYQLDKDPLLEIPIFDPGKNVSSEIAMLVEKILSLRKRGKDSGELENQVDDRIYQAYGLSREDIEVIEER